jgi:hypothetical protein
MTMPPSMRSADHLSGDASPARFDPAAVRIPGHEITREHAGAGRKCGGRLLPGRDQGSVEAVPASASIHNNPNIST